MTTTDRLTAKYNVTNIPILTRDHLETRLSPKLEIDGYEIAQIIDRTNKRIAEYQQSVAQLSALLNGEKS